MNPEQHVMKFFVHTLGCKINQYESQAIREAWISRGFLETGRVQSAGLVLVNSCAVTANAVQDLRSLIRKYRRINPKARLVVTGCAARIAAPELEDIPDIVLVPQERKAEIADFPGPMQPRRLEDLTVSTYFRSRAVVKVQDGCSHGCTYCIVPLTRGPSRSRDSGEILTEIRRLLASGIREITLGGINLRQFGMEFTPALDFWDLLLSVDQALAGEWAGRARLRISSLEPSELGPKALKTLSRCRMVCPHLHLSLQSGSAAVLERMNRGHYAPEQAEEFLAALASHWPVFGLGADILVGFPGESDEDFQKTLGLLTRLPLSYAHVFPFSPRPGTAAAGYPDQIPVAIRKDRAAILRTTMEPKRTEFLNRLLRLQSLDIVLEGKRKGTCEYYVDCELLEPAVEQKGAMIPARPTGIDQGKIIVTTMACGTKPS